MIQIDRINIAATEIWRRNLRSFGFALIIMGIPFGLMLDMFVADIGWNAYIPPLGLALIPNWRRLLTLRFPSFNFVFLFAGIFVFSVWAYVYIHLSGNFEAKYWIFVTAMYFAVMTLKKSDVDIDKIIIYTLVLGLFVVCGTMYCEVGGVWKSGSIAKAHRGRLTMGGGCSTFIIAVLLSKSQVRYWSVFQIILIFTSLIAISFNGKRTALLVTIVIIAMYLFRFRRFNLLEILGILMGCFIIGCGLLYVFSDFDIVDRIQGVWQDSILGIQDMENGTTKSGDSAVMRYRARMWAIKQIDTFNWAEFLFGRGVMTRWLDIPILQSYLDMGIYGFVLFSGLTFFYPIYCCFSRAGSNRMVFFAVSLTLYAVLSSFNSGHPYTSTRWDPMLFLYLIMGIYNKQNKKIF